LKRCPLCHAGFISPNEITLDIISLHKKGLTIREISKITGKGSTTVHYHIHKHAHGSKLGKGEGK